MKKKRSVRRLKRKREAKKENVASSREVRERMIKRTLEEVGWRKGRMMEGRRSEEGRGNEGRRGKNEGRRH